MPLSIKVNLRVTGHCNQGGRKYMEDMFSVAYQQTSDDKDLEYAFFGIFDGHGGGEAATFAKEHLMDIIVKQRNFWSDKDEDVLRAIKDGYINTHYAMWRELDKWPTTASGLPSTAGTTASVAFIRKGKVYIGHVGDSGIILGYQEEGDPQWKAKALTKDHKPESGPEMMRIAESGGKVVSKSGVPRVVWNRPRIGHKGPVRRSTHIDEIPFLAVARSLGDLWSYNSELDTFVVSPEPDVKVVTVDVKSQRCLIFGTDGLWNMLSPQAAVSIVQSAERHNEKHLIASQQTGNGQADVQMWINPSKSLVDTALERWFTTRLRADNTSVVTLMLDPPGPSRSEVLMSRKNERVASPKSIVTPLPRPLTPVAPLESIIEPTPSIIPVIPSNAEIKKPDTSVELYATKLTETTKQIISNEIIDEQQQTQEKARTNENSVASIVTTASTSRESIQVAEISSSDAFDEKSTIVETNNEIEQTTTTTTDLTEKDIVNNFESSKIDATSLLNRDVTPDVNAIIIDPVPPQTKQNLPLTKVTKTDAGLSLLVRQNAFCDSCEELQNRPRLRRNVASPFTSFNRSINHAKEQQKETTKTTPHSVISSVHTRRQSVSLVSHLESRTMRRRQSVNSATAGFHGERQKTYFNKVGQRLKRETLLSVTRGRKIDSRVDNSPSQTRPNQATTTTTTMTTTTVGSKRRHSSTVSAGVEETKCPIPETSVKRRTRSEDRPTPTDENDPANQEKLPMLQQQQQQQQSQQHSRLRWPEDISLRSRSGSSSGTSGTTSSMIIGQDKLTSPNSFQRRSLEKKATPVKTIRRPSINGSSRSQLRGSFGALREWDQSKNGRRGSCNSRSRLNRTVAGVIGNVETSPVPSLQRWLRSDTLAATPVKTLRSRNVDITGHTVPAQIAHQYGIVKQNRLSLPAKIKLAGKVGKLTAASSTSATSASSSTSNSNTLSSLQTVKLTKQQQVNVNNVTVTTTSNNNVTSTSSVITKRVKSPYNTNVRSALGTRSRLKRLGK